MQMDNDIPQHSGNWIKTSGFAIAMLICSVGFAGNIPETEINSEYLERVVKSIYIAEGGVNAKKPFGVLSVPCSDFSSCERICRNSIRNSWKRWQKAGCPEDFISFTGARYAPVGSHALNKNWVKNVKFYINKQLTHGKNSI